jgi:polyhydroxyalkanoate synthesis regulator phasin
MLVSETMEKAQKQVTAAEKRVLKAFEDLRDRVEEAPAQIRSTYESLRKRVAFASRAELAEITAKVDELSKRVDGLIKKKAKA